MTDNEKKLLEALEAVVCEIADEADESFIKQFDRGVAAYIRHEIEELLCGALSDPDILAILHSHYPEPPTADDIKEMKAEDEYDSRKQEG